MTIVMMMVVMNMTMMFMIMVLIKGTDVHDLGGDDDDGGDDSDYDYMDSIIMKLIRMVTRVMVS